MYEKLIEDKLLNILMQFAKLKGFLEDIMTIGWIGTGIMGLSMCSHLMDGGYEAVVYNRTAAKAQALVDKGAKLAASPREVASACDVVFTMVGYPSDVEEVYFGENGIFKGIRKGSIVVDMTTTKPSLAERIYAKAQEIGCEALDAPVSGGDSGARNACLSIMVGGDQSTLDKVMPMLKLMGTSIILEGAAGAGQHTKMANQIQITGTMIGMSEALLYAKKAGLDLKTMVDTISKGAAGCHALNNLAPRVIKGDYNPGFIINHFIKDMGIALEEAKRMGIELKGVELVESLYRKLQEAGGGAEGTQALVKALGEF